MVNEDILQNGLFVSDVYWNSRLCAVVVDEGLLLEDIARVSLCFFGLRASICNTSVSFVS